MEFVKCQFDHQFASARELIQEYVDSLDYDIGFQQPHLELESLPDVYSLPKGILILALENGKVMGSIGLKRLNQQICEMKRLYIKKEARGKSLGLELCKRLIVEARLNRFTRMRLDTLPTMNSAQILYKKLGFYEIEPYYSNPIFGTVFMELDLA